MIDQPAAASPKANKSPRRQQREARLKMALKANMAKRKAQMRGRADPEADSTTGDPNEKE